MILLSNTSLGRLPASVARPPHDRRMRGGVVHFGPGAFHRAHQAPVFDALLAEDNRWGITGISLNSASVAKALAPQDGLYTLALLDAEPDYKIIGSIAHIVTAREPDVILRAMASVDTRIISATVTEKGYCLAADGSLDFAHPAIVRDLAAEAAPGSFIGWVAAGLAERKRLGLAGLTILSCDNLADNGRKLCGAVTAFAHARDPDLARWIEDHCRFPCSMVDSITPATDDALRQRVRETIGLDDAWPIQRERFAQWVIEDDFAGERPALDIGGVTFAPEVRGHEAAKLRLLNGAHSSLAYIGLALAHVSVADAMRQDNLAAFIARLMREDIAPSLSPPPGLDLDIYIDSILARFANPAIVHRLAQIAWDGSQKLPYRLLDTVREAMRAGRDITRLAVPIAAWMRFIADMAMRGEPIVDPMADRLLASAGDAGALLDIRVIFGDLGSDIVFRKAVLKAYAALGDPAAFDRISA